MVYVIIFCLLILLEVGYFRVADRFNIIDKPNLRSSHTTPVRRGGGVIFLFGVWLYAAFFGLSYPWFILGLSMIAIVSFVDDIHSLPRKVRLLIQFTAMFLMFYQFGILHFHDWWVIIVALVVCVGIINAYNFMDGINGITGGYSIVVLLPLIYLNWKQGFIDMPYLYVVGLSLLAFCFFNFRKQATCFAGDVGSLSMAFIILFPLGKLILKTGDFSYIIFLAVYGADSILTICHRIQLHEKIGEAHRKHAFQIMANELKIPHLVVSSFYMALQLLISCGEIFLPVNHYLYLGIVIAVLAVAYILFIKKYYHLHEEYLRTLDH